MIIIIGDSWGVGEFDDNCNLSGPGFGQYLMLHDRVVNLSVGAASNTLSLDRLEEFLRYYQIQPFDTIFWVVTCPTRCCDSAEQFFKSELSIIDSAKILFYQSLNRADALAEKHKTQIQLIGGLYDLLWLDIKKWKNLSIRVPSWSKLIDPNCPEGTITPDWFEKLGQLIAQRSFDHMPEWLEISEQLLRRQHGWSKIFLTDGGHPDRNGHLLLRDHLYPEWSFKT